MKANTTTQGRLTPTLSKTCAEKARQAHAPRDAHASRQALRPESRPRSEAPHLSHASPEAPRLCVADRRETNRKSRARPHPTPQSPTHTLRSLGTQGPLLAEPKQATRIGHCLPTRNGLFGICISHQWPLCTNASWRCAVLGRPHKFKPHLAAQPAFNAFAHPLLAWATRRKHNIVQHP